MIETRAGFARECLDIYRNVLKKGAERKIAHQHVSAMIHIYRRGIQCAVAEFFKAKEEYDKIYKGEVKVADV